MDNKDDKLPRIPAITKEQQRLIDEEQTKMAKMSKVASHPNQRALATAEKVIKDYEVYGDDLPPSAIPFYVEALSTAGRYEDAYKWSKDDFYREINDILTNEKKVCNCPDTTVITLENGQPIKKTYSRFFTRRQIYSRIDNQWHDLKMCNVCHALTL